MAARRAEDRDRTNGGEVPATISSQWQLGALKTETSDTCGGHDRVTDSQWQLGALKTETRPHAWRRNAGNYLAMAARRPEDRDPAAPQGISDRAHARNGSSAP